VAALTPVRDTGAGFEILSENDTSSPIITCRARDLDGQLGLVQIVRPRHRPEMDRPTLSDFTSVVA